MSGTRLKESPSQTAGPYVHIGCTPNFAGVAGVYEVDPGAVMVTDDVPGTRISVEGTVFDGQGAPLTDALVEVWQADAAGEFGAPGSAFTGWGRCAADQGSHTVCAVMTDEFLAFSKYVGNDLSTPRPEYGFAGLKPGDHWCLCASRFLQAHEEGCAPQVNLAGTHKRALEIVPLEVLEKYGSRLSLG